MSETMFFWRKPATARLRPADSQRLSFEPLEPRLVLNAGPLIISEFLAINELETIDDFGTPDPYLLTDGDGEYSDWIEIHNPTDAAVNLSGWYLSDDDDDLLKWEFPDLEPDLELAADEYLVVFASNGRENAVVGPGEQFNPYIDDSGNLHTSFRLDGDGEYLALVRPDGLTVSYAYAPEFPQQYSNVSYGPTDGATPFTLDASGLRYLVPASNHSDLGDTWTHEGYDDSGWESFNPPPRVLITEAGTVADFAEIENLSDEPVDTEGWVVAANNSLGRDPDINKVHTTLWPLPDLMEPGDVLYRHDDPDEDPNDPTYHDNFWGEVISWKTTGSGWLIIVDDAGNVIDFVVWGYSDAEIASFAVNINGYDVTAAGAWFGESVPPDGDRDYSLQRLGDSDNGNKDDWDFVHGITMGEENGDLTVPFPGAGAPTVGFELVPSGMGSEIVIDVADVMYGVNSSIWTRIPFEVEDPGTLETMQLRMEYNDGFVAYINGREVARRNAPQAVAWNSAATGSVGGFSQYEEIDVSEYLDVLQKGDNVLAIQGLNVDATAATGSEGDFFLLPELAVTARQYFGPATPGDPNGAGFHGYVKDTKFSVDRGFYDDPFELTITTNSPGATIYYTLDGTNPYFDSDGVDPDESNGFEYTGPITIAGTTVLRATAFKKGYRPTNVDTHTYIFLADVVNQSPNGQAPEGEGWPLGNVNGQRIVYGMDPDIVNADPWKSQMEDALTAIPTMSMVTDLDNLFDSSMGIYVNANNRGDVWERPTSLELIYPDDASGPGFPDLEKVVDVQGNASFEFPMGMGDGFQIDAGVRIRGGYSRQDSNPKHAFRFYFNSDYGSPKLYYPLFGYEGTDRFDKIDLRCSQNYSWAFGGPNNNTMVREVTARDLQGETGSAYTRSRYYHLYINGVYWGLFQTQERSEARYAASYLGGEREDFDVIHQDSSAGRRIFATDGNTDAYYRLRELIIYNRARDNYNYFRAQGMYADGTRYTGPPNPTYERLLDVDNLIDYMIVTFYVSDTDGPGSKFTRPRPNNYWAILNREDPDGFKFFAHDMEHSYGLGAGESGNMVTPLLSDTSGNTDNFNAHWMHQELMENDEYAIRFADRVYEHFYNGGLMTQQVSTDRIENRAAQIRAAIIAESARWGDTKTNPPKNQNDWTNNVNTVKSWVNGRTSTVINQFRGVGWYPDTSAPTLSHRGGEVYDGFNLTMSAASGTIYYMLDGSDPRAIGGGIAPGAQVYTGTPVTLTETTLLKARALNDGEWSPAAKAEYLIGNWASAENLVITELNYNPYDLTQPEEDADFTDKEDFEFIELYNVGDETIDLSGAKFDVGVDFTFDGGAAAPLLKTDFDSHADGFSYVDDAFNDTDRGDLAAGSYLPSGGVSDGGLHVQLGPHSTGESTSGAWSRTFDFARGDMLNVSLHYRMIMGEGFESNEFGEVILEIDGTRFGSAANGSLIHTTGDGNGGGNYDSGWHSTSFSVAPPPGEHTITIGAYNNKATSDDEFVEVFFDNLTIAKAANSLTLVPGERVVVVKNMEAFATRHDTEGVLIAGQYEGKLRNEGEELWLLDRFGDTITRFTYDNGGNWPGRADGNGSSMELIDVAAIPPVEPQRTAYIEDGDNWRSSSEYGGSPAAEGEGPRGDVLVNEVVTHTDLPDTDSIELYNTTGEPIDVGGWYLSDTNDVYTKFRIPFGTIIGSESYVVFDEHDFNVTGLDADIFNDDPNDFALNGAHGDDVWLLEADVSGKPVRFVDRVEFPAAANGESFGRWPNGSGDLYPMVEPTVDPAGENSGPRVGPVIISEVQYNPVNIPAGDDWEFVEIYNPTQDTVNLTNWRIRKGIDFDFPVGTTLEPRAALIVVPFALSDAAKLDDFCDVYKIDPQTVQILGGYDDVLDNGGERIQLQRPDAPPLNEPDFIPHLLEDEVRYDDEDPWPEEADGYARSLNRVSDDAWGNDPASWIDATASPGTVLAAGEAQVVGRYVFYNNSAFGSADNAVAVDKTALLTGQTATFANYTSYASGINGVMIDVSGLPDGVTLDSNDFEFHVGNSDDPDAWPVAPLPTAITVRENMGYGGSDRVTITFNDGAITNQWLQVKVLDTTNTDLPLPEVFYFGNAVGDSGDSADHAKVNASDVLLTRNNPHNLLNPAPIEFKFDFNRDKRVNATDMLIARESQTHFLNALQLISVPDAKGAGRDSPPVKGGLSDADGLSGELAWIYEIGQIESQTTSTSGSQTTTKSDEPATEAVDQVLAMQFNRK